jgi:hypothetical protein
MQGRASYPSACRPPRVIAAIWRWRNTEPVSSFVSPRFPVSRFLRLPVSLVLLALFSGLESRANSADVRFSQSLSAEEKAASGLSRLNSDQVAVIDALVRRDIPGRAATPGKDEKPSTFSQRLTADERRVAGLGALSAEELPRIDSLVERYQSAKLARTLLAPPALISRASRVTPEETKPEKKIHGSFSLSYGWGKGGYSEKTGSMVLNYTDPDRGFGVTIGYSESHIKGGSYSPYYRDPYLDSRRGPDLTDPTGP